MAVDTQLLSLPPCPKCGGASEMAGGWLSPYLRCLVCGNEGPRARQAPAPVEGYYLYEHPDLTPRVSRPRDADFAAGNPEWVRCYPIEVCGGSRALTPAPVEASTQAATDVLAERQRQVQAEGYDREHDAKHGAAALAAAAGCYAIFADAFPNAGEPPPQWPWEPAAWKPKTFRHDLVRAAALLLAAIETGDWAEADRG